MKLGLVLLALALSALVMLTAADAYQYDLVNDDDDAFELLDELEVSEEAMKRDLSRLKKKKKKGAARVEKKGTKSSAAGVCRKGPCCGTANVAITEDCPIAVQRYCRSRTKCCPKILYGVDSNDQNLWTHFDALQAAQVNFVVRYVSHQTSTQFNTPAITPTEAQFWLQRGMPLVAVWETTRTRPAEGKSAKQNFANGVADAREAKALMAQIGGSKSPVYFAVDAFVDPKNYNHLRSDIKIKSVDAVVPYFLGVRKIMGPKRTGAYGSYTLIKGLFDKKLIKYGWQASSFDSHGRLDPRAQLFQCSVYPPNTFGSNQVDYDFALAKDFGQWH